MKTLLAVSLLALSSTVVAEDYSNIKSAAIATIESGQSLTLAAYTSTNKDLEFTIIDQNGNLRSICGYSIIGKDSQVKGAKSFTSAVGTIRIDVNQTGLYAVACVAAKSYTYDNVIVVIEEYNNKRELNNTGEEPTEEEIELLTNYFSELNIL